MVVAVLIESDWNLKYTPAQEIDNILSVLIESDWNLKDLKYIIVPELHKVLIESDWNLKFIISVDNIIFWKPY